MGAFGNTEKRFSSVNTSQNNPEGNLGPGEYRQAHTSQFQRK